MMGICILSTALAHCQSHLHLNPSTTSLKASSLGILIYLGNGLSTVAAHTSLVSMHTVDLDTPNRCLIVQKSVLVDKN